jgi:hypothetical protein
VSTDKFLVAVERSSNGGPFEAIETSVWARGEAPVFTEAIPTVAVGSFRQFVLTVNDPIGIHEETVDECTYRFVSEVAE